MGRQERLKANERGACTSDISDGPLVRDPSMDRKTVNGNYICPLGHALEYQVARVENWGCDACGRLVRAGGVLWGCRQCNYDKCHDCMNVTPEGEVATAKEAGGQTKAVDTPSPSGKEHSLP